MDTQRAVTQAEQEHDAKRYALRDAEIMSMEIRAKAGIFWTRIRALADRSGLSLWGLTKATGAPQSQLYLGLKEGYVYPTRVMVESLSEYFGVPQEKLLPWGTLGTEVRGEGRKAALAAHLQSLPRRLRWG